MTLMLPPPFSIKTLKFLSTLVSDYLDNKILFSLLFKGFLKIKIFFHLCGKRIFSAPSVKGYTALVDYLVHRVH